jgi:hypothetical protein
LSAAANITYGSTLAALQFANQHQTKIVINKPEFPWRFTDKHVQHAYALLYTKLMLDGQTIGGDSVKYSRIDDSHLIVACKGNVVNKIEYDNLFIFSDKDIGGLPETVKKNNLHDVVDVMSPKSLVVEKEHHILKTEDLFVSEINLLKEHRTAPIEIYILSTLTETQLNKFDYSDTMAKFKSEALLKEQGFRGTSIGGHRPPITLETNERCVDKRMDQYAETEKIKFFYGN